MIVVDSKIIKFNEFTEKILLGLRIANRKLVEKTAAENGSLIIGNIDGTCKEVPAKELLETLNKEN